jgi:hypothetical protein
MRRLLRPPPRAYRGLLGSALRTFPASSHVKELPLEAPPASGPGCSIANLLGRTQIRRPTVDGTEKLPVGATKLLARSSNVGAWSFKIDVSSSNTEARGTLLGASSTNGRVPSPELGNPGPSEGTQAPMRYRRPRAVSRRSATAVPTPLTVRLVPQETAFLSPAPSNRLAISHDD